MTESGGLRTVIKKEKPSMKKKKNLRAALITIVVLAALFGLYCLAFKQAEPLGTYMKSSDAIVGGEIVCHPYEGDTTTAALTAEKQGPQLEAIHDAIQTAEIRFNHGSTMPTAPVDGAYYEVFLDTESQEEAYVFGCNSDGQIILDGSNYDLLKENPLPEKLAAVFP